MIALMRGGCLDARVRTAHTIDAHRIDDTRNASVFVETPLAVRASSAEPCELRLTLMRRISEEHRRVRLQQLINPL